MINIELMANPNSNLNSECDLSPLAHITTEELHHEWCAEDAGLDAYYESRTEVDEGYGAAESDHVYGYNE